MALPPPRFPRKSPEGANSTSAPGLGYAENTLFRVLRRVVGFMILFTLLNGSDVFGVYIYFTLLMEGSNMRGFGMNIAGGVESALF